MGRNKIIIPVEKGHETLVLKIRPDFILRIAGCGQTRRKQRAIGENLSEAFYSFLPREVYEGLRCSMNERHEELLDKQEQELHTGSYLDDIPQELKKQ